MKSSNRVGGYVTVSVSQVKAVQYSQQTDFGIGFWGWVIGVPILAFFALIPAWLIAQITLNWASTHELFVLEGATRAEPLVLAVVFAASFLGSAMVISAGIVGAIIDDLPNAVRGNTFAVLRLAEKTGPATTEGE